MGEALARKAESFIMQVGSDRRTPVLGAPGLVFTQAFPGYSEGRDDLEQTEVGRGIFAATGAWADSGLA